MHRENTVCMMYAFQNVQSVCDMTHILYKLLILEKEALRSK